MASPTSTTPRSAASTAVPYAGLDARCRTRYTFGTPGPRLSIHRIKSRRAYRAELRYADGARASYHFSTRAAARQHTSSPRRLWCYLEALSRAQRATVGAQEA